MFLNGLNMKWRAEYSTSKSALESFSGTVVDSGEETETVGTAPNNLEFGTATGTGGRFAETHHLAPGTQYYAQFVAENSAGRTVLPFEFITSPVLQPEVSKSTGTEPKLTFEVNPTSPTTTVLGAVLQSNGAATTYSVGYSTTPSGPVTVCGTGSISVAEDFAEPDVTCTGLAPETTYYPHLIATNEKGTVDQTAFNKGSYEPEATSFTTPTAKPVASINNGEIHNITALSARVGGSVDPTHEETHWRFESAPSEIGPWTPVPGAAGTISQAEAEALPVLGGGQSVGVTLTGLTPATAYYVRLFAENVCAVGCGEGQNFFGEPISLETRGLGHFETTSPPTASTVPIHSFHGEALRIVGAIDPNSALTSEEQTITIEGAPSGGTFTLTFDGKTTTPIAYNASAESVRQAFDALLAIGGGETFVEGRPGGPYTILFEGALAEKAEPEIEADASWVTPPSENPITVVAGQKGGEGYDAHYHFQYVSEQQFKDEGEWAKAGATPEVDVGTGTDPDFVAADLPTLTPGETYRYRLVATSTFPGNPVVDGEERSLKVPTPPASEASVSCANEALRTGASANLPDCRGYEQLTPVDKEGAREVFTYGIAIEGGFALGEDGEHAMLETDTDWGSGPTAGQGPYFFSHEGSNGWRMTAASTQPDTGINNTLPQLFSPDLTSFAFLSEYTTTQDNHSTEAEYKSGAPGGPYATIVTTRRGGGRPNLRVSRSLEDLPLKCGSHAARLLDRY